MDAEKADVFHTMSAISLCIRKREIPYIQLTLPFFCNRVKGSYEDDWENLLRMIKYLQEIKADKLILKINDMTMSDWYADAAFAVHADMKIHTGGVLTMDKGAIHFFSMNLNINTQNST